MIKLIKTVVGAALLLGTCSMQAQQLPLLNHYIYNPYLYNPARTGQRDFGMASMHFKKQWTAMPNSPFSGAVTVESPIKINQFGDLGNMGLGGMLYVDQVHITTNVGGMATYAYHIPFGDPRKIKHGLSAGLSLGFIHQRFNYPDAIVENPNDNQLLPSESSGTSFDFSAGLDYQWKNLHVGVSMLQGLNIGLRLLDGRQSDIKYINTRQWLVGASYRFFFGEEAKKHRVYVEPIALVRIIEDVPTQVEINAIAGLDGIGWLGVGWRSSNNLTATSSLDISIGVEVQKRINFVYTFGIGVDPNLNTSMGTQHEFMLAYKFGENKKIKQLQTNVRDLQQKNEQLQSYIDDEIAENKERVDSLQTIIIENNKTIENTKRMVENQQQQLDENSKNINSNKEEIDELRKLIENQPLKYKKIGEIFFDNGSVKLNDAANSNLDAVKQALDEAKNRGSEIKVYIKGNASTNGDAKRNMELSMRRATAVRQYLVNKGLDGSKVVLIPMGEEDPTDGNRGSASGDSKDRRVDIIFTEKKPKGRL